MLVKILNTVAPELVSSVFHNFKEKKFKAI